MADEDRKVDEQQRTLDVEQATPSQTPVVKEGKKPGVRDVMAKASSELRESGNEEDVKKADAIDAVLKNDDFNKTVDKLEGKREQAAAPGVSEEQAKEDKDLDSTGMENDIDRALQAAREAGVPDDQISAAKAAISAYQSNKSGATKSAAETAFSSSASQRQTANDKAAEKFQQEMMAVLTAGGMGAAVTAVSAALAGFRNPGVGAGENVDLLPHQVGVPTLVAAVTRELGKGGGMGNVG